MNLDELFTITDYKSIGIEIPLFGRSNRSCKDDCDDDDDDKNAIAKSTILRIDILCSTAASTDFDLTGQIVWPVSILLSHYVASESGRALVEGQNVVELGAGCGLVGMVAADVGASEVIMTDGEGVVMDLLDRNAASRENLRAMPFTWGTKQECRAILEAVGGSVDVLVAADVVQWPTVVEPLLHSIKALLWNSRKDRPCLVLGIVNRAENIYGMFFRMARELGFAWEQIPYESFLSHGLVPESCKEFGGRETQVFVVELVDRSVSPIMLDEIAEEVTISKNIM